jgi:CubicO group peptidase (beta-lactamase class C family)
MLACSSRPAQPSAVTPPQVSPLGQGAPEPPPWPTPEAAGLNPDALRKLVDGARASDAAGLVVLKDGRVVVEERFGWKDGPIPASSVTKSVVSIAVGLLLDEGRLKSLDQPVSDFYPEWKQGRKRKVTIRHLLNHTSGLQNVPRTDVELESSPDLVQLALAAELAEEPGKAWAYNNKAVNLISGIVRKASGRGMDEYLRERLFAPLGIIDYAWPLDSAGNPPGMGGLEIRPADLARIGEMLANGGQWRGKRILSPAWIDASALTQSQDLNPGYGLLWWLVGGRVEPRPMIDEEGLTALAKAGADPTFIKKAATLKGLAPQDQGARKALIRKVFGPEGLYLWANEVLGRGIWSRSRRLSPATSFMAAGDLGAYLWVSPKEKLVVACMHRYSSKVESSPEYAQTLEFPEFVPLVEALVPRTLGQ